MNNENAHRRGIFSSFVWKFGERIAAQLVSTIVSIILARILCPEDYGIIALVSILINICNAFVAGGLGNALIQKNDADETDFSTVFWASLALSVALFFAIFALAEPIAAIYKNAQLVWVLRIMAFRIPLAAINSVQQSYISKKMQFRKFFYATLIGTIASAVVGVAMALSGYGVWALVGQYLTNSLIDTLVLFIIGWRPKLLFSFSKLKNLLPFGMKIMGTVLLDSIFNEIRSIVISKKYSTTDLAIYENGKKYPNLIVTNMNVSIGSVIFPALSNNQADREVLKSIMKKAIRTTAFILSPLLLGFMAVSDRFVSVVLTDKWSGSVPYIYISSIMCLFYPIHTINTQALNAIGDSGKSLKLEIIKKTINIAILIFSMSYGVIGIALGGMFVSLISTFINAFYAKKEFDYSFFAQLKDMANSLIISSIMYVCVFLFDTFVPINSLVLLILDIALGAFVYCSLAIIFKVPELRYLLQKAKSIIKK